MIRLGRINWQRGLNPQISRQFGHGLRGRDQQLLAWLKRRNCKVFMVPVGGRDQRYVINFMTGEKIPCGTDKVPTIRGRASKQTATSTDVADFGLGSVMAGVTQMTAVVAVHTANTPANQSWFNKQNINGSQSSWSLGAGWTAQKGKFWLNQSGTWYDSGNTNTSFNDSKPHVLVGRWLSAQELSIWVDGVKENEATGTKPSSTNSHTATTIRLGNINGNAGGYFVGNCLGVAFFTKALTQHDIIALNDIMFLREGLEWDDYPAWAPAGATGVTVAVPVGSFTLTGQAPVIATGVRIVNPTHGFTFTGLVPASVGQAAAVVDVPLGVFTLAGQAPAISIGAAVNAPAGSFTLTGHAPTVAAGSGVSVPAGSFTLTGHAPVVATGVQLAAPAATFTLTGHAPTVETGAAVNPAVHNFTFIGHSPTIHTGASIAVPVRAFTFAGRVPTINQADEERHGYPFKGIGINVRG